MTSDGDALRRTILGATSLSRRVPDYRHLADGSPRLSCGALRDAVLGAARGRRVLVLSASQDAYAVTTGGVQNVMREEERAVRAGGGCYLHVCPAAPLPLLAPAVDPAAFGLRLSLDGAGAGHVAAADLLAVLREERDSLPPCRMVVHHLMGHSPELLQALAGSAAGPPPFASPLVWVHDFFTLCPNYALLRNDAVFCRAPDLHSFGCTVCAYGRDRLGGMGRVRAFFAALRPTVLAPSRSALDLWLERGALPHARAEVIPLARLGAAEASVPRRPGPLRVAFLGQPVHHKGWGAFRDLAAAHAGDPRYAFFRLGLDGDAAANVTDLPAGVTRGDPEAMTRTLAEADVDVVMNWSLAHETFSFTTLEALAAGAFVVARRGAGNVWPLVEAEAPGHGLALETEGALRARFAEASCRRVRRRRGSGAASPSGKGPRRSSWRCRDGPRPYRRPGRGGGSGARPRPVRPPASSGLGDVPLPGRPRRGLGRGRSVPRGPRPRRGNPSGGRPPACGGGHRPSLASDLRPRLPAGRGSPRPRGAPRGPHPRGRDDGPRPRRPPHGVRPGWRCPDRGCPGRPRPDWRCPDWRCPDWRCPDWRCPDWRCPDWRCPDWRWPDWRCPDWRCPDWRCPDRQCPDRRRRCRRRAPLGGEVAAPGRASAPHGRGGRPAPCRLRPGRRRPGPDARRDRPRRRAPRRGEPARTLSFPPPEEMEAAAAGLAPGRAEPLELLRWYRAVLEEERAGLPAPGPAALEYRLWQERETARTTAERFAAAQDRLRVVEDRLAALEGSTSWRVTAPLREVLLQVRRWRGGPR
ncbi:hypothetical protein ACE7GA_08640 [Roseomonas sp. CCTCC AB2023176]|uniref:hypothetical protein n=1 Tax=Roseomonas sp. CCTCC AB2023176 TaxID=3342640 RepID=UPI0035DCF5A5